MLSNTGKLAGYTLFITGASRGIGKAIALKAARDGANIVLAAKTAEPHPKLPGTIYSAGKEIEDAGGHALPCIVDVRFEDAISKAVKNAVDHFGGIDIVVNNASAISLTDTESTSMKTYDLMHQINTRGTYLVTKTCLPYLMKSKHPHILNLSPPLSMKSQWFKGHVAYTMAKYGMSMCVLGMSEEFKDRGIACNAIWPLTAISTAAMDMLGGDGSKNMCRKPEIMADAAYAMLCRDPKTYTGNFAIDEDILREEGITNFDIYAVKPGNALLPDFFVDRNEGDLNSMLAKVKEGGDVSVKSTGAVAEVFNQMEKLLGPDIVNQTKASYAFEVKGDGVSYWYLNLKEGSGSCGSSGDSLAKADATLKMNEENFLKMFKGDLKPTAAFMTGKLKITGDMGKAIKLEKLMGSMKSKL